MIKQLRCMWLLMLALPALASESTHDHSVGTHGMVLMSVADQLLASHMPLHGGKHAHQIVLQLKADSEQAALSALLEKAELISIEPERFSLTQLRHGELSAFRANVYQGHFERQGTKVLENVQFQVIQLLKQSAIQNGKNGLYEIVPLSDKNALLIHRIGDLPSFDQIVWVEANQATPTNPLSSETLYLSPKPLSTQTAAQQLQPYGIRWVKQLYLETSDFSQH